MTAYDAAKIKRKDAFSEEGKFTPNALAVAVSDGVAVGPDGTLWSYQSGVWRSDPDVIDHRVARVLRDDYTIARGSVVERLVRYLPTTDKLETPEPKQWDPIINFRNCMVDWQRPDGILAFDHEPTEHSMIQLPVMYDADATCPNFLRWLDEVLPDDMHQFFWEVLGYLLMTGNPLQTAVLLLGDPGTGKSTLLHVLEELLGRENLSAESLKSLTENRFSASSLYGKSANIVGDIDTAYMNDTSLFLQITGGDTMTHERKGKDAFPFRPFAVPVFSTNKVWQSANTSGAYFRRWTILPFDRKVDRSKPFDETTLFDETSGIANHALHALRELYYRTAPGPKGEDIPARHFEILGSAREARERFARESDPIREWLDEDELVNADAGNDRMRVARTTLYARYASWCETNNVKPKTGPKFYQSIRSLGHKEIKSNGTLHFLGIDTWTRDTVAA
ncbi:hypothetical protein BMW26_07890 [Microbacterium sp. 1.5R]|uniref:DNA primase family protein n=1 Tax=Microbacterium sp. 1.5R TaxID=1916917 RepID=UPI00090A4312|nr:DNA primase family protein [Microbacterium sp. 1.5R]APH44887.1 hypothetical protein BMW26_07890 [Microbacterium sp. 1.5R]